jgi:hypothetical protein
MTANERPLYDALVKDLLTGVTPHERALAEKGLERYLLPKVPKDGAVAYADMPEQDSFNLWDQALNSLGTEFTRLKMAGELDKAMGVARVAEDVAARNMRRAIETVTNCGQGWSTETKQVDLLLKASRHHVLAARDLSLVSNGRGALSVENSSTLAISAIYLYQPRTTELFGRNGAAEIATAVSFAHRIRNTYMPITPGR